MGYQSFKAAVYSPVRQLRLERDMDSIIEDFAKLRHHVDFAKVYIETYRSTRLLERERALELKAFFEGEGVEVSGGITLTGKHRRENPLQTGFGTYCYTSKESQDEIRSAVRFTAEIFDEIIFDDFFFTSCKCAECVAAKGDRSWSDYRISLLDGISRECIIAPAKEVNPNVSLIIKYPNWYDHYHSTGYDLEDRPKLFEQVYAGTETRDPLYNPQNLQPYLSYFIMRYLENVKPGKNLGGWFDKINCNGNLNYYLNQVDMTLLSKPREVALFAGNDMVDTPFAPLAGYGLSRGDRVLPQLGNPIGISCYRPFHSSGEGFLYDYMGMLGIPLEPTPTFQTGEGMVVLTANSAKDPLIVDKIKDHLSGGGNILATSGLVSALAGKGIEDVALIRIAERSRSVRRFTAFGGNLSGAGVFEAGEDVTIQAMQYSTNDSWPLISGLGSDSSFPLLLQTEYGAGAFMVLSVPLDYGMLYHLPVEVLRALRRIVCGDMQVVLDAEARVALFVYDNGTVVVRSSLPYDTTISLMVKQDGAKLTDLESGRVFEGCAERGETSISLSLPAQTYRAFRVEGA